MRNDGNEWNNYLNEMRHDAIARQKAGNTTLEEDTELLGRAIFCVKSFGTIARQYGLLALEEEALNLDREKQLEAFLYDAIELIVDGCNPEWVAEILSNNYWLNAPEGYEATAQYICARGMLMVQAGEHPYGIVRLVSSMIPKAIRARCMEICEEYEKQKAKKTNEAAREFFETDFSRCDEAVVRKALEDLEQELICMTDAEIQRLLREVENWYLVQALVGMKPEARSVVARNMSSRFREMIMEDCYDCVDIDELAIVEGAEYIAEKLKVLQACGEIAWKDCR